MGAPGTGFGLLNIHSNVEGARILIDGQDYGLTPQIVRLDATKNYELRLLKSGYRAVKKRVRPRGNHQTEVYVKLKKRNR